LSYVSSTNDPELYALLVQAARHPRAPHPVYAACSDALHFTRYFSRAECAERVILDTVRHEIVPVLETMDEFNDPTPPNTENCLVLHRIKEAYDVLDDYESYSGNGRSA
jgi:hypothetical protein